MAESRAVHECLFCPQRFGSAADKDDHVLEHFAQEICIDCDQNLIRIGGKLYTLHDAATCVKREVKSDECAQACIVEPIHSPNENRDFDGFDDIKTEPFVFQDESHSIDMRSEHSLQMSSVNLEIGMIHDQSFTNFNEAERQQSVLFEGAQIELKPEIVQNEHDQTEMAEIDPVYNADSEPNHSRSSVSNTKPKCVECELCGKALSTKDALKKHKIYVHSAPGTSLCKRCCKVFSDSEQLAKHDPDCLMKKRALRQKNSVKFECDICKMVLKAKSSLRVHMQKHDPVFQSNRVKSVACRICGKVLSSELTLRNHNILVHSAPGALICRICVKLFSDQDELDEHRPVCASKRSERMKKRVQCKTCGIVLAPTSIRSHDLLYHSSSDAVVCQICRKIFSTQEQLQEHQTDHERDSKGITCFQCYLCNMEFKSGDGLRRHMRKKHVPIEKIVCDICGKVVHPDELRRHMNSVHKSSLGFYKCNMCSSTFHKRGSLKHHKRIQHDPNFKQFECDSCDSKYNYMLSLRKHKILMHSPPGAIFCQVCACNFSTKAELTEHEHIKQCEKRRKEKLARGSMVHNCPICGAGIKGKFNLNSHIRKVHKQEPAKSK